MIKIEFILNLNIQSTYKMANRCEVCNKSFNSAQYLKKHYKTDVHKDAEKAINTPNEDFTRFPLKDKAGEIVSYALVDVEVHKHITSVGGTVWRADDGYVGLTIGKESMRMNRYVYYGYYNYEKTAGYFVDHIDGERHDNRIDNLREANPSQNAFNRRKKVDATSKYYGVSISSEKGPDGEFLWQCTSNAESLKFKFTYREETHAAYHRDLLVKEHHDVEFMKLNNIKEPPGFVLKVNRTRDLPKNIQPDGKKFYFVKTSKINNIVKNGKRRDTIEEAEEDLRLFKIELAIINDRRIQNTPIKRNANGIAIIELFDKSKTLVGVTEVDDEDYYKLMKYRWYKDVDRVSGTVDKKKVFMSRFIMNYTGSDVIDHDDGDTYNNRKYNLKEVTAEQNAQNKHSLENSTSKYVGVSWYKTKQQWVAQISCKGKKEGLGYYDTEEEAAKMRDQRAHALNIEKNTKFKLNFPITKDIKVTI